MKRPGDARYAILLTASLLVGFVLRTIEYAALGSLWVDELFIALNVTTKSLGELLTSPLAFHQVAPIGFLAAEKVSTLLFGVSAVDPLNLTGILFAGPRVPAIAGRSVDFVDGIPELEPVFVPARS